MSRTGGPVRGAECPAVPTWTRQRAPFDLQAMKAFGFGLLLIVAAIGGYLMLRSPQGESPPEPAPAPAQAPSGEEPTPVEPRVGEVERVEESEVPREDRWLLPDNTWVRALNGAKEPAPLSAAWPDDKAWVPIVGIEKGADGIEWYRHSDGSVSTTRMIWRQDLGRMDAEVIHSHPNQTLPVEGVGPQLPNTGRGN